MRLFSLCRNALAAGLFSLVIASLAIAQSARTERVSFATGTNGTVIEDRITGDQTVKYVLGASKGQIMSVDMQTSNASSYFNILPPGSDVAVFRGSTEGTVADVPLPVSGDYTVEVFLMRSAARRNETANYAIAFSIHGPDYADGLAGGPDFWKVTGVGGGNLLNVRSGPATRYGVIGKLQNGDVLKNSGCRLTGNERWCQIRAVGLGTMGWVAGRFLIEAAAPRMPKMPAGGPVGNGTPFDATGSVRCSSTGGKPLRDCLFGVIRAGVGNAGVWVATGEGQERQILFEGYVPVAASPSGALSYEKDNDLFLIKVDNENYEIPSAVLDGG